MHECILKDFHLHNAISLAGRLYNALPDQYINARHYVDEVKKVLQAKVGDHTFTRKMGLNICSMLLGLDHQRKFDCLLARVEDSPTLKEPFDREIRGKMASHQKQVLDGLDKFQQLGALSKKTTDLLGLYTSNKIPMPSNTRVPTDARTDRKRRVTTDRRSTGSRPKVSRDATTKSSTTRPTSRESTRRPAQISRSNDAQKTSRDVESKSKPKGETKTKISKLNKRDLQQIIHLAVSMLYLGRLTSTEKY